MKGCNQNRWIEEWGENERERKRNGRKADKII